MIKIPGESRIFTQDNRSDSLSNVVSTFNIDFCKIQGKIMATRSKLVTSSDDQADLGIPFSFEKYNNKYWAFSDNYAFEGGLSPSDSFQKDNSSGAPDNLNEARSDSQIYNGSVYVTSSDSIYKLTNSTWTEPITSGLTTSVHLLTTLGDRLYVTDDGTKVLSVNTSDVLSTSGANTLDLGLDSGVYEITMLDSGNNNIWIGVVNHEGGNGFVYYWDGETANNPTNRFRLDSAGVVAGFVRKSDNRPFIVDTEGKLMAFNGSGFDEVDRFPISDFRPLSQSASTGNDRSIHPNGIIEKDNNILVLVNGARANTSLVDQRDIYERLPSGVWEWNKDNGLHHKYSFSYSSTADTGTTNVTDYGQMKVRATGAIINASISEASETANGSVLFGGRYYTDLTTNKAGIFVDDLLDTTQKYGNIVFAELLSSEITDTWSKVFAKYRKLLDPGDKIIVKYRTNKQEAQIADFAWLDTSTVTTTADLSNFEDGDEFEVIRGVGGGKTAHFTLRQSTNTSTLSLDESFAGATGQIEARIQNWKKAGEITSQSQQYTPLLINKTDTILQLKVCLQFTGANELHELVVINNTSTRAQ